MRAALLLLSLSSLFSIPCANSDTTPETAVPFLSTLPENEWLKSNDWQSKPQRKKQPPLNTKKNSVKGQRQDDDLPRRNVRRRYQDARGKEINRALKHKQRTAHHHTMKRHHNVDEDVVKEEVSSTQAPVSTPTYATATPVDSEEPPQSWNDTSSVEPPQTTSPDPDSSVRTYSKSKSKSKSTKYAIKAIHRQDEDGEDHEYIVYTGKGKGKSKSKSKKGKKGKKGKGGSTGSYLPEGTGSIIIGAESNAAGARYFETSLLLEMKNHYVAELTDLDLRQLETLVGETYNGLSRLNCDVQGRQLIAVTMVPTATSTGYVLHMQGQCHNCDPDHVHLFAAPDGVTYQPMFPKPSDSHGLEGNNNMTTTDIGSNTSSPSSGPGPVGENPATTNSPTPISGVVLNDTITMMSTMGMPPVGNETAAVDSDGGNGTQTTGQEARTAASSNKVAGRVSGFVPPPLIKNNKRVKTDSKHPHSRLRQSQDSPEMTAQTRTAHYLSGGNARKLNNHGHHHRHQHHHSNQHQRIYQPQQGVNVNRGPEVVPETLLMAEDRAGHVPYDVESDADADDDDDDDAVEVVYTQTGGGKGSSKSSSRSSGQSTSPGQACQNPDATYEAPTEQQFLVALNHASNSLFAQYNNLQAESAVQVQPAFCDPTEEGFESALVVQFERSEGSMAEALSTSEVTFMEKTLLQSYNHLQATFSCDLPHFREMFEVLLQGLAPGPSVNTFLAMFSVRGTCRGTGCSNNAMFFDPLDEERRLEERNLIYGRSAISGADFRSFETRSGRSVEYDGRSAHVYQEQCFCPSKIQEFGPPFLSDMQEAMDYTIKCAYDAGVMPTVVGVVDLMEVPAPSEDVDFDQTVSPTAPPTTEATQQLVSFVIIHFFGQRRMVTEREVVAIQDRMPTVYKNLQDSSFCDPQNRSLVSATLKTVDDGPTEDSFLLGFDWVGTCEGVGCNITSPMFFSESGQMFVPCEDDDTKVEGAPVIEDFENNLFMTILDLRDEGVVINIQSSGEAVEVTPGSMFSVNSKEETSAPVAAATAMDETLAPTVAPSLSQRSPGFQGRTAGGIDGSGGNEDESSAPTSYPTWLDTFYPTYLVPFRD